MDDTATEQEPGAPRRIRTFELPVEAESGLMRRLARLLLDATRDQGGRARKRDRQAHPGFAWLDSGGPNRSERSESVLTAFAWKRVQWEDPRQPGLAETLASFTNQASQNGTGAEPIEERKAPARFRGGWVGFLGYEAVEAFEPVRLQARRDLGVPVASWGLYPVWYRLQSGTGRLELWSRLPHETTTSPQGPRPPLSKWIQWARQALRGLDPAPEADPRRHGPDRTRTTTPVSTTATTATTATTPTPSLSHALAGQAMRSFSRSAFLKAVKEVQHAVREGEVFQANLAHRLSLAARCDAFEVHCVLRSLNPSPFMAYLEEGWGSLVSNSPERLFCVRREGGRRRIEVRPIAGTRPRGDTPERERRLRDELCTSVKERAEHTMLVDLARNDVGRVSRPGSVRVTAFQQVEAYSHVHHLVSRIEGTLRDDVGFEGLLRALFPGGTITGAPKLRSIEVIDRVEPVARGPYTGSLGYVNPDGTMDLNILIRTLIITGDHAHAYAGAGIVAQSEPDKEYEETLHKATAMLIALAATPARPREDPVEERRAEGPEDPGAREDEETQWIHAARRGFVPSMVEGQA